MAQKVVLWCTMMLPGTLPMCQTAPEILVVDSDGEMHDLYADYLDNGQSVMMHIFYSSCPPCQTIASPLEALYQEWGAGAHQVQFIGLSNQDWETDETVNNFKSTLGVTSPHVSADGGSLPTVDALVNGGFGNYFGAPLYIVISPDGTVEWDVFGFGDMATIDSIDAALIRTGAAKPTSGIPVEYTIPFVLQPNPATNQVRVMGTEMLEKPLAYALCTPHSQIVVSGMLEPGGVLHLDRRSQAPGVYFLLMYDADKILGIRRLVLL